jgi:hypothetical protein
MSYINRKLIGIAFDKLEAYFGGKPDPYATHDEPEWWNIVGRRRAKRHHPEQITAAVVQAAFAKEIVNLYGGDLLLFNPAASQGEYRLVVGEKVGGQMVYQPNPQATIGGLVAGSRLLLPDGLPAPGTGGRSEMLMKIVLPADVDPHDLVNTPPAQYALMGSLPTYLVLSRDAISAPGVDYQRQALQTASQIAITGHTHLGNLYHPGYYYNLAAPGS